MLTPTYWSEKPQPLELAFWDQLEEGTVTIELVCAGLWGADVCYSRPPSLEDAPEIFAGAHSLEERLERLISELFDFYERGASYIETDFQERQLPIVQEWEAHMRAMIEGLVREALRPVGPAERMVGAVSALLDFSTFKSFLKRDIQKKQAAKIMNEVLLCWVNGARPRELLIRGSQVRILPGAL